MPAAHRAQIVLHGCYTASLSVLLCFGNHNPEGISMNYSLVIFTLVTGFIYGESQQQKRTPQLKDTEMGFIRSHA
jgi:hypothetical protein